MWTRRGQAVPCSKARRAVRVMEGEESRRCPSDRTVPYGCSATSAPWGTEGVQLLPIGMLSICWSDVP